jgi:hypothetical protein
MNRAITITVIFIFVALAAIGAMFLLFNRPSNPAQQGGQTNTSNNSSSNNSTSNNSSTNGTVTKPTPTADPAKAAIQTAYLAEVAKHPGGNTQLYELSVVGEYALQVWIDDYMGGQALLRFDTAQQKWVLVDGGGGAWSVDTLVSAGVPEDVAQKLLAGLKR